MHEITARGTSGGLDNQNGLQKYEYKDMTDNKPLFNYSAAESQTTQVQRNKWRMMRIDEFLGKWYCIDWFEVDKWVGLYVFLQTSGPHLLIMNTWWNIKLNLSHYACLTRGYALG